MLTSILPSPSLVREHPSLGLSQLSRITLAEAQTPQPAKRNASWQLIGFWIGSAVLLICAWLPRLLRSFWVDEAGTFLMAHNGPLAAIRFTSHWPGQSLAYAAIASLFATDHGAFRELALRIPSSLGVLLGSWFLYQIAEKAIGRGSGFVAAMLFVFHPTVIDLGTQARPYGLAMAAVAGSCLALMQWVTTRKRSWLLLYVAASTSIVYLHYFFIAIFVCHAAYLAFVLLLERRRERWQELLASYGLSIALTAPLWPHMRLLLREAHTLPFTAPPTPIDLYQSLLPTLVAFGALASALVVQMLVPKSFRMPQPLSRSLSCLLITWWVLIPVLFFVASVASPMRVFLPRYFASSVPGQVLVITYAGYSVFRAVAARIWVVGLVLLSTASPVALVLTARKTGDEELRPVMKLIQDHSLRTAPPVFFSSPLPESNFYAWRQGLTPSSYLYAPFVAYPMKNRILPLPYTLDTQGIRAHVENVISTELKATPQVLFISHSFAREDSWNNWLIERMSAAGFSYHRENLNAYYVLIFQRP